MGRLETKKEQLREKRGYASKEDGEGTSQADVPTD